MLNNLTDWAIWITQYPAISIVASVVAFTGAGVSVYLDRRARRSR
jgi:hypothetical protein